MLFLDELSEFSVGALQALRQPLEDGRVAIARAGRRAVHPARFMLIAATNPCPCGYAGTGGACTCSESELARHRRRLSGPLLDRIDLLAPMLRPTRSPEFAAPAPTSAQVRGRVVEARARQRRRLAREAARCNGEMDAATTERTARPDEPGALLLERASTTGLLSARGRNRVLRVARTLADLDGRERVSGADIGAALALRPEAFAGAPLYGSPA